MEAIIGCLFGIFVGMVTAGYMYISECEKKENRIAECTEENKLLREELDDVKFDLSVANKEIELQDKQIECIRTVLEQNNYGRDDIKIAKLKELVKEFQAIN